MQTEFRRPVIDFFPPIRRIGEYGTRRMDYGIESICPLGEVTEFRIGKNGRSGSLQVPSSYITAIHRNTTGGFRVYFSDDVGYDGNFGGGIELHIPHGSVDKPHLDYNHIARVWRDGKIIWKNRLLPKKEQTKVKL